MINHTQGDERMKNSIENQEGILIEQWQGVKNARIRLENIPRHELNYDDGGNASRWIQPAIDKLCEAEVLIQRAIKNI